jgi:hypothetical protein
MTGYLDRLKGGVLGKQAPMALQKLQEAPFYSSCSTHGRHVSEIEGGILALTNPLSPLPPAAETRRRKVLGMQRGGTRYGILVEDASADPVVMALATPDGTCEVQIPRGRYDPFRILELAKGWEGQAATVTPISGVPCGGTG